MAKKGQHKNDAFDQTKSPGHNNPGKSQTITTGSYKKPETYKKQAFEHKDPHKQAQAKKNEWQPERTDLPREESRLVRARLSSISGGRSGSDSNRSRRTRGH